MENFKPLRYFKEELTEEEIRNSNHRELNLKFQERVYKTKLDNHEKHKIIMDLISSNKKIKFSEVKQSEKEQKKIIATQRQKIVEDNKRKMLEIKWNTKMCQLSLDLRRQHIQNNHWRIGDLTPGLEAHRKNMTRENI